MRNVWLLLVMVATLPTARLAAQDKTQSAKEQLAHKELRAMRDDMIDAVKKYDLDRVLTFLDDDVEVTWQNSEVSRGPEEVRAYCLRMMKGPNRILESIDANPTVDAPAQLYGDDTAVAYGISKDHFKLTDGRDFEVDSRWSATVVKKNGQWKIVSFHMSANMFDNPVMWIVVKRIAIWTGIAAGIGGLLLGFIAARLLRRRAPTTP